MSVLFTLINIKICYFLIVVFMCNMRFSAHADRRCLEVVFISSDDHTLSVLLFGAQYVVKEEPCTYFFYPESCVPNILFCYVLASHAKLLSS